MSGEDHSGDTDSIDSHETRSKRKHAPRSAEKKKNKKVVSREPQTGKRTTRQSSRAASGSGNPKRLRVTVTDEEHAFEEEVSVTGSDEDRSYEEPADEVDGDEVPRNEDADFDEEEAVPGRRRKAIQYRNRITNLEPYENFIDGDVLEEVKKGPLWPLFDTFHRKLVTAETVSFTDHRSLFRMLQHFESNKAGLLLFRFGEGLYTITDETISDILGLPVTGEMIEDIDVDPEVENRLKLLFGEIQQSVGETSAAGEKKKGKSTQRKSTKGKSTKRKSTKGNSSKGNAKVRVTRRMVEAAIARVGHTQPTNDLERLDKTRTIVRLLCLLICSDFLLSNVSNFIADGLLRAVFGDYTNIAWAVEVRAHLHKSLKRPNAPKAKPTEETGVNSGGCVHLFLYWLCERLNVVRPIPGRENERPLMRKWHLRKAFKKLRHLDVPTVFSGVPAAPKTEQEFLTRIEMKHRELIEKEAIIRENMVHRERLQKTNADLEDNNAKLQEEIEDLKGEKTDMLLQLHAKDEEIRKLRDELSASKANSQDVDDRGCETDRGDEQGDNGQGSSVTKTYLGRKLESAGKEVLGTGPVEVGRNTVKELAGQHGKSLDVVSQKDSMKSAEENATRSTEKPAGEENIIGGDGNSPKRKLLILDVNGILADSVSFDEAIAPEVKEDTTISNKKVFKRPHCDSFLEFCFQHYNVGVWSSRTRKNLDPVVDYIFGHLKEKLLFSWDQSRCTHTSQVTLDNPDEPLYLKPLKKLWDKLEDDLPWPVGEYNKTNTLLVDDSPYTALCNPVNTAIFPTAYKYVTTEDSSLGPGGEIRSYLERLAGAVNVEEYVQQHPFGQGAITYTHPSWDLFGKLLKEVDLDLFVV